MSIQINPIDYLAQIPYEGEWVRGPVDSTGNSPWSYKRNSETMRSPIVATPNSPMTPARYMVSVNLGTSENPIMHPFYVSSGQNVKKGVVPGDWYPFMGTDSGWLRKISLSDGRSIGNYYDEEVLASYGDWLNRNLGDLRDADTRARVEQMMGRRIPSISSVRDKSLVEFLNQGMPTFGKDQEGIRSAQTREHLARIPKNPALRESPRIKGKIGRFTALVAAILGSMGISSEENKPDVEKRNKPSR